MSVLKQWKFEFGGVPDVAVTRTLAESLSDLQEFGCVGHMQASIAKANREKGAYNKIDLHVVL